jgi:hypothetical protein
LFDSDAPAAAASAGKPVESGALELEDGAKPAVKPPQIPPLNIAKAQVYQGADF